MKRILLTFTLAATMMLLSGCASPKGPKFSQSGDADAVPPAGKAQIFIVRKPQIVDAATQWMIGVNDQYLVTIPNGGYYRFAADPGTLRFSSQFKMSALHIGLAAMFNKYREVLKLEVESEKTYYLKLDLGQLTVLSPEKGKADLAKSKRVEEPPPARETGGKQKKGS